MADNNPTPAELADQAAEAIRALIHATLGGNDLKYPGDAYSVVGNLSILAHRLPHALGQIRDFVDRLEAESHLRSDNGPEDLPERLHSLRAWLAKASGDADSLGRALDEAHSALGPIAWHD